jgi:hypothetical protein
MPERDAIHLPSRKLKIRTGRKWTRSRALSTWEGNWNTGAMMQCEPFSATWLTVWSGTPTIEPKSRINRPAKGNGKCADSNLLVTPNGSHSPRCRLESLSSGSPLIEIEQSPALAITILRGLADSDHVLSYSSNHQHSMPQCFPTAQVDNALRNRLIVPVPAEFNTTGTIQRRQRLGGMLNYWLSTGSLNITEWNRRH